MTNSFPLLKQKGAAVKEFALILPFVILLSIGGTDAARGLSDYYTLLEANNQGGEVVDSSPDIGELEIDRDYYFDFGDLSSEKGSSSLPVLSSCGNAPPGQYPNGKLKKLFDKIKTSLKLKGRKYKRVCARAKMRREGNYCYFNVKLSSEFNSIVSIISGYNLSSILDKKFKFACNPGQVNS